MKVVKISEIDWDLTSDVVETSGEGETSETLGLPSEVIVVVGDDWDADEEAADLLSDEYGWCVNSCSTQVLFSLDCNCPVVIP